ncbi:phosphomannomutase [Shewanella chilikensis]|uniref:phosphomannomutase n=1 Tax=Shewanella chilikensis TaxID=558541 RepID=UPI0030069A7E
MVKLTLSDIIRGSGIVFGTSGARGLVTDFTPNVCTAFTLAFIQAMKQDYDVKRIAMAIDNRPSSPQIVAICIAAAKSAGVEVDYYGVIPTPALALTSMADNIPAIMVTGSHIPFDRNGLKFYRPDGEISKADELAFFNANGSIPQLPKIELPLASNRAANAYIERYLNFFRSDLLKGMRIGIYEHSSAGRDLYPAIFEGLGATVVSISRSDFFVPIDTEAVEQKDIEKAKVWQNKYKLDSLFSTDGDGDRPLLADETGTYMRGDVLCLLAAKYLNVEAISVPINCNSAIENSSFFKMVKRTKIGSPYVIAELDFLKSKFSQVAGFEANGGFVLGTPILLNAHTLAPLPTRDAILPALAALALYRENDVAKKLSMLVPNRYTSSGRLQNFTKRSCLHLFDDINSDVKSFLNNNGLLDGEVVDVNNVDGVRITLSNNSIVHFRMSGNAPELRCYFECDNEVFCNKIVGKVLSSIKSNYA